MPPRKDSRERIMDAACDLFLTSSYDRVSVDEIARRAGVSKGGLFHHFGSKYELARESLIHHMSAMMGGGFHERIRRMKGPESKVRALIDLTLEEFASNTRLLMFIVDVYEEGLEQGDDMGSWREFYGGLTSHVEALLRDCGLPRPKEKARLLMAALDGLAFQLILLQEDARGREVGRIKKELLRMVFEDGGGR
jgi:AcrR family transcriptional regulator